MILTQTTAKGGITAAIAVALFFCAGYGARYLSLNGDQVWVFQRLVGFVACDIARRLHIWQERQ